MARVFITGSSDGLGLMAGRLLADQGHRVVLHARNEARAADTKKAAPRAEAVVVGDLASIAATKDLAAQVNALGPFDAVIHNAAVGFREQHRVTRDDLPHVFAINTLAPYILTALIGRPKRLVYLSSGMHARTRESRRYPVARAAVGRVGGLRREQAARRDAGFRCRAPLARCAVERDDARMGGDQNGRRRRARRHRSGESHASVACDQRRTRRADHRGYFYHMKRREPNPEAQDVALQDRLIAFCRDISRVDMPQP